MHTEADLKISCHLCGSNNFSVLKKIEQKPAGETEYGISSDRYYREICQCAQCMVYFNRHADLIPDNFYEGHYNGSIKAGNLLKRFKRIISFDFDQSDNKHRALRVAGFLYRSNLDLTSVSVLDIGTGTGVFPYEMKKFGCQVFCVDPDPTATAHARENIQVNQAFTGIFSEGMTDLKFDLITFNKVLEHVQDPVSVLQTAKKNLADEGYIYVELPDGSPVNDQPDLMTDRSEFYLEHYTTFNVQSYRYLAEQADMEIEEMNQITDPSGKFTIYGFLKSR